MISKKWLGATITVKHKNIRQTVTIVDDKSLYPTYRALGLDHIFEECETKKKMTFPKTKRRKKKSDSNLSDTSKHSSIDTNREDNDK